MNGSLTSVQDYVRSLQEELRILREAVKNDPTILERAAEIRKRLSLEAEQRKEELNNEANSTHTHSETSPA